MTAQQRRRIVDAGFSGLWDSIATALADRTAVLSARGPVTYTELERAAARLAAALSAAGVATGDTVGCCMRNSEAYIQTLWAIYKLGAIPVNVNYRYTSDELIFLFDDARLRVLMFEHDFETAVRAAASRSRRAPMLVRADGQTPVGHDCFLLADLVDAHEPLQCTAGKPDDRLIIYTGGTTGLPKGVVWRQGDFFETFAYPIYGLGGRRVPTTAGEVTDAARAFVADGTEPVLMPVAPLMHGTAFVYAHAALSTGGTIVFADPGTLDAGRIWSAVQSHRVTQMVIAGNGMALPLAAELTRAAASGTVYDTSSLKLVLSSGVAWTNDVKRTFLEHGSMTLCDILAASEGGPFAFAVTESLSDLPSAFRLVPGASLLDEEGNEIEPGSDEVGVLAYSGGMPLGYLHDDRATARVYRNIRGRRHVVPGDLARLNEDGTLELLGRGSAVINSGGEKVYAGEVESALLEHPGVIDCAVIGTPDVRWNEVVTAVVQPTSDRVDPDDLAAHVATRLAGYKKPRRVYFVDAIPRWPSGKVIMPELRAVVAQVAPASAKR
jgi:acyl-CoA synthetase (AMP-forming)/AMP-acid ligase II